MQSKANLSYSMGLDLFQKYLCSLNYFTDFKEDKDLFNKNIETDENDLLKSSQTEEKKDGNLVPVPISFMDIEEYTKIWQNLFFLEAKAQILKAKFLEQEEPEAYYLKAADEKHFFYILQFSLSEGKNIAYAYHDLVLITPHQNYNQAPNIENEHLLGLIESSEFSSLKVRIFVQKSPSEELMEQFKRYEQIRKYFASSESVWYIQKLCNVVTLDREYQALHSISDLYLKETLIAPANTLKNVRIGNYFAIPEKLEAKLKEIYNESQILAIKETLKKEGITLIQGPPGTGKTTTVLGTISVLLNSMNESMQDQIRDSKKGFNAIKMDIELPKENKRRRDKFDEEFELTSRTNFYPDSSITDRTVSLQSNRMKNAAPPEKILICAPSNAAIDEIVRKILEKGLLDANGNRFDPFLVRIGPNVDRSLEDVSLDVLVEREIQMRNVKEDTNNGIRIEILKKAKLVCGTLSSAGSQILISNPQNFDTVVIDEAAQGIEISTLIPLKFGCKRLILIGDPQQLPATIFSKTCEKYKYDLSLFERLQKSFFPVFLLKSQYRMHPRISQFISTTFYNSEIKDAEEIMELIGKPLIYKHKAFQPFIFFHIEGLESFVMNSFRNESESSFIVALYEAMKRHFPESVKKMGVISPYSQQVYEIRRKIQNNDASLKCFLEVNTVDGFQGREKDIIVFSTVRSKKADEKKKDRKTIGFLKDRRRMNVSLSRARVCLIVVGNAKRLQISKLWRGLIEFAMKNQSCFRVETPDEAYLMKLDENSEQFLIKTFEDLGKKQ